jgi:hypothetical protein
MNYLKGKYLVLGSEGSKMRGIPPYFPELNWIFQTKYNPLQEPIRGFSIYLPPPPRFPSKRGGLECMGD